MCKSTTGTVCVRTETEDGSPAQMLGGGGTKSAYSTICMQVVCTKYYKKNTVYALTELLASGSAYHSLTSPGSWAVGR